MEMEIKCEKGFFIQKEIPQYAQIEFNSIYKMHAVIAHAHYYLYFQC